MNAIIAFAAFLVGIIAGGVMAYNAGYEIGFLDAKRGERKWE